MTLEAETLEARSRDRAGAGRTRFRALAPLVLFASATWLALTAWLLLWPDSDEPVSVSVDAVVPLAGADGQRLRAARDLLAEQPEAALVLSMGDDRETTAACQRPAEGVHCFRADPHRTSGEARAIGRLARQHGWKSVAVVTTTTHLTRARLLIEQCVDGEVVMIDAGLWRGELPGRLLREWGGLLGAFTFDRAC
ncbi:MAG TPA: ElyC/SanA/YdcF family protein [Egibacteraceae bacterium]|nr:ElyC/SanA/YdcF family protein [Egibacteraceae bacterium]